MAAAVPAHAWRSVLVATHRRLSPVLSNNFYTFRTLQNNRVQLQTKKFVSWSLSSVSRRGQVGCLCRQASLAQAPTKSDSGLPETINNGMTIPSGDNEKWAIKMLYDGDCPLCMREVNMLRERNKMHGGTIKFVDISTDDYSAQENAGIDFATAMDRIHAVLPDGNILRDIAAFQRLYEEVGLGWIYSFTNFRSIAKIADTIYSVWAKYRLPITGRPPLVEILEKRRRKAEGECKSDQCLLD